MKVIATKKRYSANDMERVIKCAKTNDINTSWANIYKYTAGVSNLCVVKHICNMINLQLNKGKDIVNTCPDLILIIE